MLTDLRLAISFFTILPSAPRNVSQDFSRVKYYFTFVGLLFGSMNLLIFSCLPNSWLAALGIVLANIFLSGGLHLDGLMDSFDGIAANKKTREETLLIMKDSRVGAFGAMAAPIVIVSQIIFLAQIKDSNSIFWLLLCPILSRLIMSWIMFWEHKSQASLKSSLAIFQMNLKALLVNLLFTSLIIFGLTYYWHLNLFPIILEIITGILVYKWLGHKLQGHNGDSMGAGLMINETLFFLQMLK